MGGEWSIGIMGNEFRLEHIPIGVAFIQCTSNMDIAELIFLLEMMYQPLRYGVKSGFSGIEISNSKNKNHDVEKTNKLVGKVKTGSGILRGYIELLKYIFKSLFKNYFQPCI